MYSYLNYERGLSTTEVSHKIHKDILKDYELREQKQNEPSQELTLTIVKK